MDYIILWPDLKVMFEVGLTLHIHNYGFFDKQKKLRLPMIF